MAATATTKTESPVELIRSAFDALDRHDLDAMSSTWADDIEENFVAVGVFRGKDAVRGYFSGLIASVPDLHIEIDRMVGEGETVFVKWRATGTFSGEPYMGIDATGKSLELEGMDCFTVRDGLVHENFVVYDGATWARQVGMLPAQGSAQDRAMIAAFNGVTRLRRRLNR